MNVQIPTTRISDKIRDLFTVANPMTVPENEVANILSLELEKNSVPLWTCDPVEIHSNKWHVFQDKSTKS